MMTSIYTRDNVTIRTETIGLTEIASAINSDAKKCIIVKDADRVHSPVFILIPVSRIVRAESI
jgi:hypothetical protein